MKKSIFLFILGMILFVCQTNASTIDDVSIIETEMINFFRSTLQRDYGCSDGKALKLMMDALLHYKNHYIIDAEKEVFKEINKKLHSELFGSYLVETQRKRTIDSLHTNWERFDPYQIFNDYVLKRSLNGETYLQKELMKSMSPLLKDMCKAYVYTGSLHITIAYGKLGSNQYGCLDAFERDRDVQFLITWIFWQYLCYCANVDFMTGEDKTKLYIGMRR